MFLFTSLLIPAFAAPTLAIDGVCPGTVTVTVEAASPDGRVALAAADETGAADVPAGSCAGTALGLSTAGLRGIDRLDTSADGSATIDLTVPLEACGRWLQGVDLSTCDTTDVAELATCGPVSFDGEATEIGSGLDVGYEPSGADWHDRLERLFIVHDGGKLTSLDTDGTVLDSWTLGGDLEGVTIPDPETDLVYVGVENPAEILEVEVIGGTIIRRFDASVMDGATSSGLEALTFVPDISHPEGGTFYAGDQETAQVFVFELPIVTSSSSTEITLIDELTLGGAPGSDLSGLDYDPVHHEVYAIFDSSDLLISVTPDGEAISSWDLPHDNQEGYARSPSCDVFIALDSPTEVWRYQP